jgi:putative endonuclease
MFYIYILYSVSADKYYVGYTGNYHHRLHQHNYQSEFNTFTSKYRPWALKAVFEAGISERDAVKLERFIKKQKSRQLLEKLCDTDFMPSGVLAQLVSVPDFRD